MEIKKELIKMAVLGVLKKEDLTSVNIHSKIEPIINISDASLFAVVKSLEEENLISNYQRKELDRTRKIYQITSLGKVKLETFDKDFDMAYQIHEFVRSCK